LLQMPIKDTANVEIAILNSHQAEKN